MEFKKFLQIVNEAESTAEKDDKAKKAGEEVTKDIEYDEDHKGSDDERAEKAGKKVAADIRYDDKKKKSLKEYFEETEQEILNEGQFPIPVVGPDNKPVPGQAGFLNVNVPGQAGVAVNDMLRRLGARGLSIILPPNRIQQQQQQAALAAAKRASVQTSGKQVAEDSIEEGIDDILKLGAKYGDDFSKPFKNFASGFKNPQSAINLPNQSLASKAGAATSRGGPAIGAGAGAAGMAALAGDDKPAADNKPATAADNKPAAVAPAAPAQPVAPAASAQPVAPVAPDAPKAPNYLTISSVADVSATPPPSAEKPDEIDRIQQLAGMSDEERYGKVGAEIRRLDPEAYKNRPRDYQGNIDLLNKLRAQKAGDSTAPADDQKPADAKADEKPADAKADEKPADAKADEKPEQPSDAADELEPVTVTGKRTQPKDQDKPGDAELGRLLNLAGANTYDELNNYLKTGSTQAPAQPAAPKDDTLDQLQKDVDTVNQEPVDAAGDVEQPSEPAEEPAKADVKTSYQIRDPNTGRTRPVSKEKYDSMVGRNQIDANVPLDYAFKVRNPSGEIETVTYKDNPERWSQIASQNAGAVGDLNTRLGAQLGPKEKEPDVKGDGKSLFRKLFNIGKDDQGYYMGKKRGKDNAPEKEPAEEMLDEAEKLKVQMDKRGGGVIYNAFKKDKPADVVKPTGEYKDKSVEELKSMLAKLKKSGPHDENSPQAKKMRQINFALRAKGGWKKGEGAAMKEEKVDEKFASQQQAKLMHAVAGDKSVAKKTGVSQDVAKEFIKKSHGQKVSKLPKKVKEAEIPKSGPDYGAGLGAGRSDNVLEAKPDFIDLDNDGNKKESMKKAAADKKKKKVNESMSNLLKAAYSEGYVHGLREQPCRVKHYEDMEEAKHYFEGYKCGLEECYGLVPGRGYVDEETSQDVVDDMASFGAVDENTNQMAAVPVQKPQAQQVNTSATNPAPQANVPVKPVATAMPQQPQMNVGGVAATKQDGSSNMGAVMQSRANLSNIGQQAAQQMQEDDLDEMDKGDWLKHKAKTTPGDTFKAFGQTFKDKDVSETYAFEDLENQLNALLTESKVVNEGLSVSMSTGQEGSPNSVSVTATDGDSEKLLAFIKQVGLGGFGDKESVLTPAEPTVIATASDYGAPKFNGHDMPSMDDLLSKLTGLESHDDHGHGHDHGHEEEHTCNECGMMESSCGCEKKTEEVLETTIEAQIKSDQLDEAAPALAALGRLAGLAGRAALANPVKTAMLAKRAASAFKKDKEEVGETETLDQREFMVAEDDGEGYEQSQADAGKIDSALALSGASKGGATNEDAGDVNSSMKDIMSKLDNIDKPDSPEAEVVSLPGAENLGKGADGMPEFDVKNQSSNTSSYEVDGKPASKAEYDNAMKNFKMPTMPSMPNMAGNTPAMSNMQTNFDDIFKNMQDKFAAISKNLGGTLRRYGIGNMGQEDEKYITLPGGSKVNMADFDKYVLPPVDVTSKRATPKDQELPGDRQLGDLLNLSGANTYDELAAWLKSRGLKKPSIDDLQPVKVTGRRVPTGDKDATRTIPPTDDMLQPVKVTGKRVGEPSEKDALNTTDMDSLKAQLDAMLKGMPGMEGDSDELLKSVMQQTKLDEWANDAGQKGTDAAFTRDTDFMTQTISGGLNKPKSTGQTTIPVIAGQEAREGDEDVKAWKKLAGLAK